ncbi:uncharacterized protein LOC142874350 [Microcebus murinus]|uniref:uncharacterized protein LOC142874350 n=1 Tax=Microcebus murinus TaxID=30608 RepID=UPI003F6D1523
MVRPAGAAPPAGASCQPIGRHPLSDANERESRGSCQKAAWGGQHCPPAAGRGGQGSQRLGVARLRDAWGRGGARPLGRAPALARYAVRFRRFLAPVPNSRSSWEAEGLGHCLRGGCPPARPPGFGTELGDAAGNPSPRAPPTGRLERSWPLSTPAWHTPSIGLAGRGQVGGGPAGPEPVEPRVSGNPGKRRETRRSLPGGEETPARADEVSPGVSRWSAHANHPSARAERSSPAERRSGRAPGPADSRLPQSATAGTFRGSLTERGTLATASFCARRKRSLGTLYRSLFWAKPGRRPGRGPAGSRGARPCREAGASVRKQTDGLFPLRPSAGACCTYLHFCARRGDVSLHRACRRTSAPVRTGRLALGGPSWPDSGGLAAANDPETPGCSRD